MFLFDFIFTSLLLAQTVPITDIALPDVPTSFPAWSVAAMFIAMHTVDRIFRHIREVNSAKTGSDQQAKIAQLHDVMITRGSDGLPVSRLTEVYNSQMRQLTEILKTQTAILKALSRNHTARSADTEETNEEN